MLGGYEILLKLLVSKYVYKTVDLATDKADAFGAVTSY